MSAATPCWPCESQPHDNTASGCSGINTAAKQTNVLDAKPVMPNMSSLMLVKKDSTKGGVYRALSTVTERSLKSKPDPVDYFMLFHGQLRVKPDSE